jgi:chitin synthase
VSKRGGSWVLHYVKSAYGVTDTPDQVWGVVWGVVFLADHPCSRSQSWSRSAGGGSMVRSSPQFTERSSSTTYTALRTPLRASSGFTSSSSIRPSTLSFPGLPSCAALSPVSSFLNPYSFTSQGNFFISFFVLTNALEDPTIIGGKGIELFNTILKYSYVGLLLTCFILSLGNRPQGSNKGYTLAFIGFAVFTLYMTVRCPPRSRRFFF